MAQRCEHRPLWTIRHLNPALTSCRWEPGSALLPLLSRGHGTSLELPKAKLVLCIISSVVPAAQQGGTLFTDVETEAQRPRGLAKCRKQVSGRSRIGLQVCLTPGLIVSHPLPQPGGRPPRHTPQQSSVASGGVSKVRHKCGALARHRRLPGGTQNEAGLFIPELCGHISKHT